MQLLNAVKSNLTELTTKSAVQCDHVVSGHMPCADPLDLSGHAIIVAGICQPSWSMGVFVFTPIPPSHGVQFYRGAGCTISGSPWISQAPTFHYK